MTPAAAALTAVTRLFSGSGMLIELLAATLMFTWWQERRRRFAVTLPLMLATAVVVSGVWRGCLPQTILVTSVGNLLVFALFAVMILACWRVNARQALFYFTMAGTMQHFVYRGARLSSVWMHLLWEDAAWIDTYVYAAMQLPFLLVGYWCFARPLVRRPTSALAGRSVFALLAGMTLCVSVFTNLFNALALPEAGSAAFTIFSAFDLVTCIFMMALANELVVNQVAKADGEVLRGLLRQQERQLAASKETIDLINVKTHDLKRQIALLGPRMSDEQKGELSSLVDIYDASVRTGNEALDVLLAQKSMQCEQRGVRFDRMVDGRLLAFMNPVDLYSLFGNAIDNALEAVDRLPEAVVADTAAGAAPVERYIAVRVHESKDMAMIRVENPFSGDVAFRDGLPVTTKDDERYHGFGTRSIRMIADRYDGTMSIVARGGVFRLTVILPLQRPDDPS